MTYCPKNPIPGERAIDTNLLLSNIISPRNQAPNSQKPPINPNTTILHTTPSRTQQNNMSLLRTIALRAPRAAPLAGKRARFSTSQYVQKDSGSAVKDTIDSVNKTVGEAAVKGIEKGREFVCFFLYASSDPSILLPSIMRLTWSLYFTTWHIPYLSHATPSFSHTSPSPPPSHSCSRDDCIYSTETTIY